MLLDSVETVSLEDQPVEGVGPHEYVCDTCRLVTQRGRPCGASFGCTDDYRPTFNDGG